MSNDDFDDDIDFGGDTYLPDCDPKPATRGDIYWATQELEAINGTLGLIQDEMVELKRRAPAPSYPAPIFMAGIFLVGAFFGWLLTPTNSIRQVYTYHYQISRAGAPRLAIDPGAGLGIRPLPKLLPPPTKKGGDHE
jgi:hypothetical protein